jgi:hypothetical protein
MLLYINLCSLLENSNWLYKFLIPCPLKKLTGIDCPGCGFQRSLLALIDGDLNKSLHLYPATIPYILTAVYVILSLKFRFDRSDLIKKILFLITGSIMMVSYIYKMYHLYS